MVPLVDEEEIVATVTVVLVEDVKSASSATSTATSHVSARKTRISATVAMVLDILQKTANRDPR